MGSGKITKGESVRIVEVYIRDYEVHCVASRFRDCNNVVDDVVLDP